MKRILKLATAAAAIALGLLPFRAEACSPPPGCAPGMACPQVCWYEPF